MDRVLSLIEHYGYLVVLFGVMLESTGVPLPGETILLAAGVLAQQGHLHLGYSIAFGILGAVLGDQIGYWVGREGGRPFVLRWGRYVWITPERLGRAEAFFTRHGGKAVVLVGYFLRSSLSLVERWIGRATILVFGLLGLAVVLYLAYRWVAAHPELFARLFERLGGERLRAFLRTSAGRWLKRRFSPRSAYGLVLTVGLVLTALFSWAFGAVVQDVLAKDPLVRVDAAVLRFF